MKHLVLLFIFSSSCLTLFAQKKVGDAVMSNGRVVVLFDDNSWMYKDPPRVKTDTSKAVGAVSRKYPSTNSASNKSYVPSTLKSHYSSTCGARTKSGGFCKRKVKGGGRCYQHGG